MNDDVKRQLAVLIEQAGTVKERATLLVMLNMADCLASTSQVIADLVAKVNAIGTQLTVQTERRSMMARTVYKAMPYILTCLGGVCVWAYNNIEELQNWRIEHSQYHKDTDK